MRIGEIRREGGGGTEEAAIGRPLTEVRSLWLESIKIPRQLVLLRLKEYFTNLVNSSLI